jgi:hypothetical protein
MKKIVCLLKALKCVQTNAHLAFTKYELHLLADRLNEPIEDLIDRLCELEISNTKDLSIAYFLETHNMVGEILNKLPKQPIAEKELWIESLKLTEEIIKECSAEIQKQTSENIINALGDVSETMARNRYLIEGALKGL